MKTILRYLQRILKINLNFDFVLRPASYLVIIILPLSVLIPHLDLKDVIALSKQPPLCLPISKRLGYLQFLVEPNLNQAIPGDPLQLQYHRQVIHFLLFQRLVLRTPGMIASPSLILLRFQFLCCRSLCFEFLFFQYGPRPFLLLRACWSLA